MSRISGDAYSISRPTGRCAHTGEAFQPGDRFVAALVERAEEEGFERVDYSAEAWDAGARPERLFGFWRAVMPAHDEKPKLFIDDDGLLALFESLLDEADDEGEAHAKRDAFRWVLTLILLRRRLLKQVGASVRGGRRVLQLRQKGSPPEATPVEVADPGMDEAAAAAAADQLSAVMWGEA